MAQDKSQITFILYQAWDIIVEKPDLANIAEHDPKKYKRYQETIGKFRKIPYIASICEEFHLDSFEKVIQDFPTASIQDFIDVLGHQEDRKTTEPVREEASISSQLENEVALYEEHLLEVQKQNDGKLNSVLNSSERIRKAMLVRERLRAINENRARISGDEAAFNKEEKARYERQFTKICGQKQGSQEKILENVSETLTGAVYSYINNSNELDQEQKEELLKLAPEIIKNAQYLSFVKAIDITNVNDLATGIGIAVHLSAPEVTTPLGLIYDGYVKQEQEIRDIKQNISLQELQYSELESQLSRNKDSIEIQNEIAKVQANLNNLSNQLAAIPTDFTKSFENKADQIESFIQTKVEKSFNNDSVVKFVKNSAGVYVPATNPDGSPAIDRDFIDNLSSAGKTIDTVQSKLSTSGIQPWLPPEPDVLRNSGKIEAAIRKEMPGIGLSLTATPAATQAAILISDPKSQNRDLSAQAILLYGKGLTLKELDEVIEHAKNNPNNSELGRLLKANPNLFGNLRHQLSEIEKTQSPEAISARATEFATNPDNKNSSLSQLYSQNRELFDTYTRLSKTLSPKELADFAKANNINPNLLKKAGKELNNIKNSSFAKEIGKPLSNFNKFTSGVSNKISTSLSKFSSFFSKNSNLVNFALDPVGSARSWASRRATQLLFNRLSSVLNNKTADFFLKGGLQRTINNAASKLAAKAAAKFAGSKLATSIGIKLALKLAVSSTVIGTVLVVASEIAGAIWGAIQKGLNQVSQALWGEDFNLKVAARDTAIIVVGGVGSTVAAVGAIAATLFTTTVVAASSAIGIIVVSIIAGYFFYITSLVVAPIISTLAQLESQSKSNKLIQITGDCAWPVGPGWIVNQGPSGRASHYNVGYNEAIDIATPMGTPVISATSGIVSFAGFSAIYLNTNIVVVESTLKDGTAFKVIYAHLSGMSVSAGTVVGVGDPIGSTGTAGTGPHLHYEYHGLKYNQCPAGGIQLTENCPATDYPGPDQCSLKAQVSTK